MLLVVAYVIMVSTMKHVPGAEVLVALIAVPRLHDVGRSGWWLLPLLLGEIVAVAIGWSGGEDGILLAGGIYVAFCLLLLVGLAFIPGQANSNRWGVPPEGGIRFRPERASTEAK